MYLIAPEKRHKGFRLRKYETSFSPDLNGKRLNYGIDYDTIPRAKIERPRDLQICTY